MSLQILRNRTRSNGSIKPEPIQNVTGGNTPIHYRNYPIRQADYNHNGQFVGPNTVISMSFADKRLTSVEDIIKEENRLIQSGGYRLKRIEDRTMLENSPFRQLMGDFRFTKDGGREFLPRRDVLELLKHDDVTVVRELSNRFRILPRDVLRAVRQYRITGEFKNIVMVYEKSSGIGEIKDEYDIFNSRFGYNVNILDKQTYYIPSIESFLMNNVVTDPNVFKHNRYSRALEKTEFNNMFVESRVLMEPLWGPILIKRYPLATEKIIDWETGDEVMVNINPMSFYSYVSDFRDVLNIEYTYNRRYIYNPWRRYGKFALDGINSDLATGGQFIRHYGDSGTADKPNKNSPYGITRFIKRLNLDLDEADIKLLRKWGINPKQLTNDINLDGEYMDPNRRAAEINGRQYRNATNMVLEPNIHFNQSIVVPELPESVTDTQNQHLPQLILEDEQNISYANNSDDISSDENVNDNDSYTMGNKIVFDEETERELEEEFKRIADTYNASKVKDEEAKKLNQSSTNKKKEDNNNSIPDKIEQVSTKVEICNDDTIYNSDSNTIVKTIKVDSSMIKLKDIYDKCYNPKTKTFNSVLYNEVVAKIRLQKDYEFNQSFKVPSDCRSIHPTYKGIPNEYVMSTTFIDTGEEFLKYLLNNKLDLNKPTNVTALPNTAKYYCSIRFTNKFDSYTSRNIYCKDNDNIVHNVVDIDLGKSSSTDNWIERRYNNYVYKHNPKKIVQLFTHHIGMEVSGGEYSCRFKNNLTTDKDGNPLINYYTGKFDGIYIVTINNYTTDCVKTSNAVDISNSVIRDNVANKEAINYSGEGAHSSSLGLLYNTNHVDKLNDENKYYLNHNGTKRIIKIDFIPYSLLTQLDMVYNSPDHYYYSDKLSMLFTTNGFEPSAHNLDYLSKYDTEGYIKHRIKFSNLFFYNDIKIKTDINPLLENDLEKYFNSLGSSIQPIKDTTLHKILPINGSNIDVDVKAYVSPNSKYNKELLYYGIRDGCIKIPIRSNDIISSSLYKDNKETDIIRVTYNRYGEVSSYIDIQIEEALTKLLIFTKPEAAIDRSTLDDYILKYQPDLFKNVAMENLKHEHTAKIEEIKHEHTAKIEEIKNGYTTKLAELKQEHTKEIKEIENKHTEEMQAKEDIFKEKELELKRQVEEASGKRADEKLRLENEKLLNDKKKLEIEKEKLVGENIKISNDYNIALKKIEDDRIQFDEKMRDAREQFNRDLDLKDKTLNAKIETEKAQLTMEYIKLNSQYNLKIEELSRKEVEWQAKLAQEQTQFEARLAQERKEHEQKEKEFKLNLNKSKNEFRKKLKQQDKEFKSTLRQKENEIKQKYISQNKDIMAKLVMQYNDQKQELDVLRTKLRSETIQAAKERGYKSYYQSCAHKAESELTKLKSQLNITETNNKLDKEYKATVMLKNIDQTFEAQENAKDRKTKKQELAAKQYHESIEAAKDRRARKQEADADRKHKTIEAAKDRKAKAVEAANDRKFKAAEAKKERKEKREERAHKEREAAMDRAQKTYENNVDRRMKLFEMDYNAKLKEKEADRKFEDSLMSGVGKAGVTILGAMSKRWFK